ncbi:MAG: pyrroline-5-carboxylate reductase [bacterium]|nr:pyrroline-5-carboxylate reductase [bacterium]
MLDLKVTFLGAGNMAEAIIKGILKDEFLCPHKIFVSDIRKERIDYFSDRYKVNVFSDNVGAVKGADVVILSIKPQVINQVIDGIRTTLNSNQIVISIAAGISTKCIEDKIKKKIKVIRIMPNMPALIGQGISAISLGKHVQEKEAKIAYEIFSAIGEVVNIEEKLMDAVTALSGSGPAYVFAFIEALVDAGVELGISREISFKLAVETVKGAVLTVLETGKHPVLLKEKVASPGGTTISALHILEEWGFRSSIISAVRTAAKRSLELSQ